MSQLRRIAPEAAVVGLGQAAAALAALFTVHALTTRLHPHEFGALAIAMTMAGMGQQLIISPMGAAFVRFYAPAVEEGRIGAYVRSSLVLFGLATAALLAIAAAIAASLAASGHSAWLPSLFAALAFAWTSASSSILDGVQNAARQRSIVALHQGIGGWLRLGLIMLLARPGNASSSTVLWAYAAGYAALIISQTSFLARTLRRVGDWRSAAQWRPLAQSMWKYSWPFSSWGIFTWVQSSSDRWSLAGYAGLGQAGLYQSLYQVAYYPASLASQFLLQVVTPVLFARSGGAHGTGRRRSAMRWNSMLAGAVLGFSILVAGASAAGGHHYLALLLGRDYRASSSLISILILAAGCFAAGQIASLNLMASFETRRLVVPKIATAIAGALLNVAGAAFGGAAGVALAQLVFSAGYLTWVLLLFRKSSDKPLAQNEAVCGWN